jgi:class 3 adenylate cyclase
VVVSADVRYAESGDGTHVAYEVTGHGDVDLLYIPPATSQLDLRWEEPHYARVLKRLAAFSRLATMDKRGSGLSDRRPAIPVAAEQVEDVIAVLDAVGSQRAFLFGSLDGAAAALLTAAAHPNRVLGVIAYGALPRVLAAPDFPGLDEDTANRLINSEMATFGTPAAVALVAPSMVGDHAYERWYARLQRSSVAPGEYVEFLRAFFATDVRDVIATVRVPVLVMRKEHDTLVPAEAVRWLADHLPNSRYVEVPGRDWTFWTDGADTLVEEIETFVTGRHAHLGMDRVLATVLFTDIVDSTRQAAELGDTHWTTLLDQHDAVVRTHVERWRGRVVKSTGDGALATFDGPARALECAANLRDALRELGIEIRTGVHTGEVEIRDDDLGGIAVHIAARIEALARPGEILVSRTVTDLVAGSGLAFDERGVHALKGVPNRWQLFAVADPQREADGGDELLASPTD